MAYYLRDFLESFGLYLATPLSELMLVRLCFSDEDFSHEPAFPKHPIDVQLDLDRDSVQAHKRQLIIFSSFHEATECAL